jgi:hypothetical protein
MSAQAAPASMPGSRALAALQRDFLATLAGSERGMLGALDGGHGVAPTRGLQVYVHAYSARLREALGNDHAALAALLGEAAWERVTAAYVAACPSRHASLRHFGDRLPAFLRGHGDYAAQPLLAELAAFERALLDSFDAADATAAAWRDLLELPAPEWPGLRPRFIPSLQRLATAHGAVEAWKALRANRPPPAGAPTPGDWAVWRDEAQVTRFRSLPEVESALLAHFLDGGDFSAGCTLLTRWHSLDAVPGFALAQWRRWCDQGWIAAWRA